MKAHSLSFLTYASSHAFASLVFPFLPVRALLNCTVSLIWEGYGEVLHECVGIFPSQLPRHIALPD